MGSPHASFPMYMKYMPARKCAFVLSSSGYPAYGISCFFFQNQFLKMCEMLYTSATILDSNAGLVALAQVSYMLGLAMALIWAARSSPSTKGSSILRVQAHMKFKSHLKIITKIYQQYFKHYVQVNLNIFQPTITNKLWKKISSHVLWRYFNPNVLKSQWKICTLIY